MKKVIVVVVLVMLSGCAFREFKQQLNAVTVGPVILVNKFNVDSDDRQHFLIEFAKVKQFMQKQPGYISSQLHQPVGDSEVWMNLARWESNTVLKNAILNPGFKQVIKQLPGRPEPVLFKEVKLVKG